MSSGYGWTNSLPCHGHAFLLESIISKDKMDHVFVILLATTSEYEICISTEFSLLSLLRLESQRYGV